MLECVNTKSRHFGLLESLRCPMRLRRLPKTVLQQVQVEQSPTYMRIMFLVLCLARQWLAKAWAVSKACLEVSPSGAQILHTCMSRVGLDTGAIASCLDSMKNNALTASFQLACTSKRRHVAEQAQGCSSHVQWFG